MFEVPTSLNAGLTSPPWGWLKMSSSSKSEIKPYKGKHWGWVLFWLIVFNFCARHFTHTHTHTHTHTPPPPPPPLIFTRSQRSKCDYHCCCLVAKSDSLATAWTVSRQIPLSTGFSRQEHWSGLPFPTPGKLSDPRIKPTSLETPALAGRFFILESPGKPDKWD